MYGIENYSVFIISGIILNLTPGSDTMYILGQSISNGKRAGILSVFGISSGIIVHTLLVAYGLSIILTKSIIAFNIIKISGAIYLIYIGIVSFKKNNDKNFTFSGSFKSKKVYFQGLLTNVLNPKVALFFITFLPQFVKHDNTYGVLPFFILGITFVTTGTIWCLIIAYFSGFFADKIKTDKKISSILNYISGTIFLCLGFKLLFSKFQRT